MDVFDRVLAPALAAQLFAVVLTYLLVVRKRMTSGYRLYAVFLVSFILLLLGKAVQYFVHYSIEWYINWFRVGLFMAVGIPSLFIVSARQAGFRSGKGLYYAPFTVGTMLALSYIILHDARLGMGIFPEAWTGGAEITQFHVDVVWVMASLGMLALPNIGFMVIEWRGSRNATLLAFMGGAVLFGLLMAMGAWFEWYSLYYMGSMISALLWCWAMFRHVRDMKGRVGILKDELEELVQAGTLQNGQAVELKLAELEALSQGDISVYKLRMREILASLADATIRAGGDSEALIERAEEREQQIVQSDDPQQMRDVLRTEAVELSGMISDMQQEEPVTVRRAREFMEAEFGRDLSVDEMAEHLGVSRSYFMREFKKATGKTVNQHLTALRIEKAKELLADSKTVTETAFEVGYNHANYFSTVFKKQTGMSPVEFQKSISV